MTETIEPNAVTVATDLAKHFVTEITDERFTYRRNEDKIAAEKQLDGIYIVRSNVEPERFDAAQTVRAYKDLSKVERAFRCFKTAGRRRSATCPSCRRGCTRAGPAKNRHAPFSPRKVG